MNPSATDATLSPAAKFFLFILVAAFAVVAWWGLEWRLLQDTPLFHYIALLINEHGYVPYRDVFETSMPGTLLFHVAITSLLGYGDLAFRLFDLFWLAALTATTWFVMRRIAVPVAWFASFGFALAYLLFGQDMALQRDYLGLLPIALALLTAGQQKFSLSQAAIIVGALFGFAAAIKPHLGIGLPIVFLYMLAQRGQLQSVRQACAPVIKTGLLTTLGFVPVFAMPLIWLWSNGGLHSFIEMFTQYLPLHVNMTGLGSTVTREEHFTYSLKKLWHGTRYIAPPAVFGVLVAMLFGALSDSARRLAVTLACLLLAYCIYAALGGKFWLYHWVPFRYFAILCAALMLSPLKVPQAKLIEPALLVGFVATLTIWVSLEGYARQWLAIPASIRPQLAGKPPYPPKGGRVDEIAEWLISANLQPGDRVQPLDWAESVVHSMLLARAKPATPYIYDYYFYHYISDPYIQTMRARFIADLKQEPPRFIIRTVGGQLRPSGLDTTDRFVELEEILNENYETATTGERYEILELKQ